jgi:hypothetical protein
MDSGQALTRNGSRTAVPDRPISPTEVWARLTANQQHAFLQALLLACQDLLARKPLSQTAEVRDE